jgi:hypothetical protein
MIIIKYSEKTLEVYVQQYPPSHNSDLLITTPPISDKKVKDVQCRHVLLFQSINSWLIMPTVCFQGMVFRHKDYLTFTFLSCLGNNCLHYMKV